MLDLRTLVGLALVAGTGTAHADGPARADLWMVAEAPAAVAVSDAQQGVFRAGVMPAVGGYLDNGWLAFGARLRVGVLRNGPAPGGNFDDPQTGGLGTATLAMRVHRGGVWAEVAGGGGFTGSDLVPTVEGGVGWGFEVGKLVIGPGARYVRVIARDPMSTLGTASLLLVGFDVQWGHDRQPARAHLPRPAIVVTPAVAAPEPEPWFAESDHDQIVDRDESCAESPEGCSISEHLKIKNDRIVLDERVLFDTGKSRVRSTGRELLAEIAAAWRAHPEWKRMTIEGHTDVRGSDAFNQVLSEHRAQRTREALVRHGFSTDVIDVIGYGRSRPRDAGTSEAALHRNRRVEFVIDREGTK